MKRHATIVGEYRYWLERHWEVDSHGKDFLNFVMLNPSTADGLVDDHTIRKCIGFAKRWGFGGMHVVNLFALRSTDPKALYKHPDPVGPDNAAFLEAGLFSGPLTIVAWGGHGSLHGRAAAFMAQVAAMSSPPRIEALRINDDGSPGHPLYIPYDTKPVPFKLPSP